MSEEKGEPVELLSRFADPDATDEVDLGPCRCPGAPHERDSAQIRTDIGDGEAKSVRVAGWQSTGMEYYDFEVANDAAIAKFTVSWNLLHLVEEVDDKTDKRTGKRVIEPVAITRRTVSLLDEATRIVLLMAINKPFEERHGGALPNASGARSPGSSPASASPNRAARRRR